MANNKVGYKTQQLRKYREDKQAGKLGNMSYSDYLKNNGNQKTENEEEPKEEEQQQTAPSSREHVDVVGTTHINNVDENGYVSGMNISGSDQSKAGTTEYQDPNSLSRDINNPTKRSQYTYDENGNVTRNEVSWNRPEELNSEHIYLGDSNTNPGQTNEQRTAIAEYQKQYDDIVSNDFGGYDFESIQALQKAELKKLNESDVGRRYHLVMQEITNPTTPIKPAEDYEASHSNSYSKYESGLYDSEGNEISLVDAINQGLAWHDDTGKLIIANSRDSITSYYYDRDEDYVTVYSWNDEGNAYDYSQTRVIATTGYVERLQADVDVAEAAIRAKYEGHPELIDSLNYELDLYHNSDKTYLELQHALGTRKEFEKTLDQYYEARAAEDTVNEILADNPNAIAYGMASDNEYFVETDYEALSMLPTEVLDQFYALNSVSAKKAYDFFKLYRDGGNQLYAIAVDQANKEIQEEARKTADEQITQYVMDAQTIDDLTYENRRQEIMVEYAENEELMNQKLSELEAEHSATQNVDISALIESPTYQQLQTGLTDNIVFQFWNDYENTVKLTQVYPTTIGNALWRNFSDTRNAVLGYMGEETVSSNYLEYLHGIQHESLSDFEKGIDDLVDTIAYQTPQILIGMATGGSSIIANIGMSTFINTGMTFLSSSGAAFKQAQLMGFEPGSEEAFQYAFTSGLLESCLQFALNGISPEGASLFGNLTKGIVSKIAGNSIARRVIAKLLMEMISEGTEEGLQEVLGVLIKNTILGTNDQINPINVAYSAVLGALTAGIMNSVNVQSTIDESKFEINALNSSMFEAASIGDIATIQRLGLQADKATADYFISQAKVTAAIKNAEALKQEETKILQAEYMSMINVGLEADESSRFYRLASALSSKQIHEVTDQERIMLRELYTSYSNYQYSKQMQQTNTEIDSVFGNEDTSIFYENSSTDDIGTTVNDEVHENVPVEQMYEEADNLETLAIENYMKADQLEASKAGRKSAKRIAAIDEEINRLLAEADEFSSRADEIRNKYGYPEVVETAPQQEINDNLTIDNAEIPTQQEISENALPDDNVIVDSEEKSNVEQSSAFDSILNPIHEMLDALPHNEKIRIQNQLFTNEDGVRTRNDYVTVEAGTPVSKDSYLNDPYTVVKLNQSMDEEYAHFVFTKISSLINTEKISLGSASRIDSVLKDYFLGLQYGENCTISQLKNGIKGYVALYSNLSILGKKIYDNLMKPTNDKILEENKKEYPNKIVLSKLEGEYKAASAEYSKIATALQWCRYFIYHNTKALLPIYAENFSDIENYRNGEFSSESELRIATVLRMIIEMPMVQPKMQHLIADRIGMESLAFDWSKLGIDFNIEEAIVNGNIINVDEAFELLDYVKELYNEVDKGISLLGVIRKTISNVVNNEENSSNIIPFAKSLGYGDVIKFKKNIESLSDALETFIYNNLPSYNDYMNGNAKLDETFDKNAGISTEEESKHLIDEETAEKISNDRKITLINNTEKLKKSTSKIDETFDKNAGISVEEVSKHLTDDEIAEKISNDRKITLINNAGKLKKSASKIDEFITNAINSTHALKKVSDVTTATLAKAKRYAAITTINLGGDSKQRTYHVVDLDGVINEKVPSLKGIFDPLIKNGLFGLTDPSGNLVDADQYFKISQQIARLNFVSKVEQQIRDLRNEAKLSKDPSRVIEINSRIHHLSDIKNSLYLNGESKTHNEDILNFMDQYVADEQIDTLKQSYKEIIGYVRHHYDMLYKSGSMSKNDYDLFKDSGVIPIAFSYSSSKLMFENVFANILNLKEISWLSKTDPNTGEISHNFSHIGNSMSSLAELTSAICKSASINEMANVFFDEARKNTDYFGTKIFETKPEDGTISDLSEFKYFNNGEETTLWVSNDIKTAFDNMFVVAGDKMPGFTLAPAIVKAVTTSLNPVYVAIKNPLRDLGDAMVYTRNKLPDFMKFYNPKYSIGWSTSDNPFWQIYSREANFTRTAVAMSIINQVEGKMFEKNGSSKITQPFKKLYKAYGDVANHIEHMPRYAEWLATLNAHLRKNGGEINSLDKFMDALSDKLNSEAETKGRELTDEEIEISTNKFIHEHFDSQILSTALNNAKDITLDFSQMGAKMKGFNSYFIYSNATFQDIYRFFDAFSNKNYKAAGKSVSRVALRMVTAGVAPPIINEILMQIFCSIAGDDWKEKYNNLNQYTKDNFFIIPWFSTDGTPKFLSIPKARSTVLYGNWIQGAIHNLFAENEIQQTDFEQMGVDAVDAFLWKATDSDFLSTLIRTLNNVDHYGSPISDEINENTSALGKTIDGFLWLSGNQWDEIIKGYGGFPGDAFVTLSDDDPYNNDDSFNYVYIGNPNEKSNAQSVYYDKKELWDNEYSSQDEHTYTSVLDLSNRWVNLFDKELLTIRQDIKGLKTPEQDEENPDKEQTDDEILEKELKTYDELLQEREDVTKFILENKELFDETVEKYYNELVDKDAITAAVKSSEDFSDKTDEEIDDEVDRRIDKLADIAFIHALQDVNGEDYALQWILNGSSTQQARYESVNGKISDETFVNYVIDTWEVSANGKSNTETKNEIFLTGKYTDDEIVTLYAMENETKNTDERDTIGFAVNNLQVSPTAFVKDKISYATIDGDETGETETTLYYENGDIVEVEDNTTYKEGSKKANYCSNLIDKFNAGEYTSVDVDYFIQKHYQSDKYANARDYGISPIDMAQLYSDGVPSFKADKDEDGNSISGTKKAKQLSYVANMDIPDDQKIYIAKEVLGCSVKTIDDILKYKEWKSGDSAKSSGSGHWGGRGGSSKSATKGLKSLESQLKKSNRKHTSPKVASSVDLLAGITSSLGQTTAAKNKALADINNNPLYTKAMKEKLKRQIEERYR